ncbi:MAG: response regulator [Bacilli bacterium]|nr:response regulator [Bacilli bacterium]
MKDVNILINAGVNVQASLELLGDMEMYDETLSDFLDMVDEKKSKLEKFLADNDMPNYAIEIHALKSDARYLGFLELGDLAYDSEMKSKAGDSAGVNANHPTIMEKLQNMISIASTYLGRATAAPAEAPAQVAAQPEATVAPQPVIQPQMQQPMSQPQQIVQPQQMPAQQIVQPQMQQPMTQPMAQGYAMPQQPMMQSQMQQMTTPNMMNQGYMSQPQLQQPMAQGYGMPVTQPVQTEAIYDLATGTIQQQPVSNPVMQQPMDPMSQALYNQQQTAQHQMPTNLMPKAGTILVVDDSNLVANFVKKIFDARYDVVIANDGAKAIELCADDAFRSKIKACLLDLNMPNVDGYQVLEDFYGKGYFVKMPIAVISGVEDMESIDKVNKYPIIDILAKPFNERDVQRVVEKCLAAYF